MNAFLRHPLKLIRSDYTFQLASKYSTPAYRSHRELKHRYENFSIGRQNSPLYGVRTPPSLRSRTFLGVDYEYALCMPLSYNARCTFHSSACLQENPSSKVEVTVNTMKNKQKEKVEEIIKEAAASATSTTASSTTSSASSSHVATSNASGAEKAVGQVKKPLKTRIWEELVHYYHGFRLLFIDINICRKLLWRVLNGKTLTRRENKLLVRTTSDLFRLIPFSVFIIVPFMEFLLPVFIKFFPGMLPSTFQTAKEREDKLKQSVQVRLEMAKFLQKTLDEMAVQHKEHKSVEAKQFAEFFQKIKDPNEYVPSDDIIKFAKRFEDEITLDSLSREQLAALCRVLEINTVGTTNLLRFQLRVKLRSLAADDRVIAREGVQALDLFELQQACKARGMRAYGLTSEKLRSQLQEWIDLSLNERVPPTLLLLSRAMLISEDTTTTDKLKETIRVLPESVAVKTKDAIGESEGKIDNKTKIQIIQEEERKIKEEREEEREEEKAIAEEKKAKAEILLDKAPVLDDKASPVLKTPIVGTTVPTPSDAKITPEVDDKESISSKDVQLLSEALKSLSSDKKMVVEKEAIKGLKEELADYKEDVEELREVRSVVKEPVHESRAAKLLFKKVNSMIGHLDKVLIDLEKKQQLHSQKGGTEEKTIDASKIDILSGFHDTAEFVRIDELVDTIKKLKQTSDESRLKQIESVLSKIDSDKDGVITLEEVRKVVEAIGRENVKLDTKQIEEVLTLLDKENLIQTEEKIEKAIQKSIKQAKKMEEDAAAKLAEELIDSAPELKDKATDLNVDETKNVVKTEEKLSPKILEAAVEKQKEKIIPKNDISSAMPPTIPPPPPSQTSTNPKDKML